MRDASFDESQLFVRLCVCGSVIPKISSFYLLTSLLSRAGFDVSYVVLDIPATSGFWDNMNSQLHS